MLALLLLLSPANAQELLVLDWSKGPVRYHLESLVDTPRTMLHEGVDNLEARATRHLITADVSCSGTPAGKKWDVQCVLETLSVQGVALPGEEATLKTIFADYQQRLQGKTVALKVHGDGRILGLDLKGVEKTDKRSGIILDTIRMLMRRLFAPLDFQLPKKGDAKGKPWKQKGSPLALELLSRFGTAGGTRLEHQLNAAGEKMRLTSQGRGMVSPGNSLEAGTGAMMKIETSGRGVWDAGAGLLAWREIQTAAQFSVSAYNAGSGGADYQHKGWAAQYGEDGALVGPD